MESFEEMVQETPLLNFVAIVPVEDNPDQGFDQGPPEGIFEDLYNTITKIVKRDGIKASEILPDELEEDVIEDAIENIYHDAAHFYYWYFLSGGDDDRKAFVLYQKPVNVQKSIADKVKQVVEFNLAEMRENEELTPDQDVDGLAETITDDLTRYIQNWQDWYYDRKKDEAYENYFETAQQHDAIYNDSYGDLSNIIDIDQYDGWSDVPYYSEPE